MTIKELLAIFGVLVAIYIFSMYFGYRLFGLSTLEMLVVFIILCIILERL